MDKHTNFLSSNATEKPTLIIVNSLPLYSTTANPTAISDGFFKCITFLTTAASNKFSGIKIFLAEKLKILKQTDPVNIFLIGIAYGITVLVLFLVIKLIKKILFILKKIFYKTLKNILMSSPYFLPLYQLITLYRDKITEITFLPLFIKEILTKKTKNTILTNISFLQIFLTLFFDYTHVLLLIFAYIFIVKEKNFKVNYFIRFNTMHAILMLFIQMPILYTYQNLLLIPITNNQIKLFLTVFADGIIFLNFYLLFYLIACAITNTYANVPIITSACEAHIGKKDIDK